MLKLEQVYLGQMSAIRQRMFTFARARGFMPLRRGRHAHASIFGVVNGLASVIDIEMEFASWDQAPPRLELATPFVVFATVFQDAPEGRRVDVSPYIVKTNFASISDNVEHYLAVTWRYLQSRSHQDLQFVTPETHTDASRAVAGSAFAQ